MATCKNCGQECEGAFCSHCGFKQDEMLEEVIASSGDEIVQEEKKEDAELAAKITQLVKRQARYRRIKKWSFALDVVATGLLFLGSSLAVVALIALVVVQGVIYTIYNKKYQKIQDQINALKLEENTNGDSTVEPVQVTRSPSAKGKGQMNVSAEEAEKKILSYLNAHSKTSMFMAVGIIGALLALLFIPFFSMLIVEASVFDLIRDAIFHVFDFDWEWESVSSQIFIEIAAETKTAAWFYETFNYETFNYEALFFQMSFLFMFLLTIVAPAIYFATVRKKNKMEDNLEFKNSLLYRYRANVNEGFSWLIVALLVPAVIVVVVSFPAIDFLFTLPKYFGKELTANGYWIVLILYLTLYFGTLFMDAYFMFSKRYKRAYHACANRRM